MFREVAEINAQKLFFMAEYCPSFSRGQQQEQFAGSALPAAPFSCHLSDSNLFLHIFLPTLHAMFSSLSFF